MIVWSVALAQQPVRPVSDQTELQPCLDTEACSSILLPLMSETMAEFGAISQYRHVTTSALTGRGTGLHFGLQFDSLVLGEKNLVTQELQLPPVLPKLEVGYQYGSFTYDDPYPQFAVGMFLFPPIKIGEDQVGNVGGSLSSAVPLGVRFLFAGLDVDASYGYLHTEIAGDGDIIEDIDAVAPFVDIEPPPCDATEAGCIDKLRHWAVGARIGLAIEPHPLLFVYGRVGGAYVSGTLIVAYDESRWRVAGLQPQFDYGGGVRIGDRIQLSFGGRTALRREELSTDDSRTLTRIGLSFSIRTGDARYWESQVPQPETAEPEVEAPAQATQPTEPDEAPDEVDPVDPPDEPGSEAEAPSEAVEEPEGDSSAEESLEAAP